MVRDMEMCDWKELAELLFPDVNSTPEELEQRFPERQLPEGAKVTRFAPSPTGFVHFGGMYQAVAGERLAHQSGGVFYLRTEDTDGQREVEGAVTALLKTLEYYGVNYDEGMVINEDGTLGEKGAYGPYKQSERAAIYHVYAKKLVSEGKAYPCFTTEEELAQLQQTDKKEQIKNTDWHTAAAEKRERMLEGRRFTMDEVRAHLAAGDPFVLRILADGDPEKKITFTDLVKGKLELPENDEDFVLLKSDGIPTYHFAHAVDDHLMRTTHVVRGEDWLPSLPKHIQLFRYLGFRTPKYLHTAQILKMDENGGKKKLSKRDMGAKMDDYREMGIAPECVWEYLLTLLNSNYEEWHMQNPDKSYLDFPLNIKKLSVSGCLFDMQKLTDVSKNVISRMDANHVYSCLLEWTGDFDPEFHALLARDKDYAVRILSIGRGGRKPRKDLASWADARPYMGFFYDELLSRDEQLPDSFDRGDVRAVLDAFEQSYDEGADSAAWFDGIKAIASAHGFAADMKAYKADPDAYKGSVADVSMFLRLAVTGKTTSPDLYEVMHILGRERVMQRIAQFRKSL